MSRFTKSIVVQYCRAASDLITSKAQLRDCLTRGCEISGVMLWIVGNPKGFSLALAEDSLGTSKADVLELGSLLQKIEQPVVGLVLGCVSPLATELLRACDHVVAASSAEFSLEKRVHLSAEDAAHVGIAHRVLQVKDLFIESDVMTRMFEIHSPSDLVALKSALRVRRSRATPGIRDTDTSYEKQMTPISASPKLLPPPSSLGDFPSPYDPSSASQAGENFVLPAAVMESCALSMSGETSDAGNLSSIPEDDLYISDGTRAQHGEQLRVG